MGKSKKRKHPSVQIWRTLAICEALLLVMVIILFRLYVTDEHAVLETRYPEQSTNQKATMPLETVAAAESPTQGFTSDKLEYSKDPEETCASDTTIEPIEVPSQEQTEATTEKYQESPLDNQHTQPTEMESRNPDISGETDED